MIKIENISFKYKKDDNEILKDLSFNVNDGEILAIVGENGSGKSTIGKLISGIVRFKTGKIFIDDLDISKKENLLKLKNKIGIVFQNPESQIIFNNIYDEIGFSLENFSKKEIDEKICMALEKVDMIDFKDKDLYNLSLGQKQRIVIAEVLAKNPKYIILDEPTTMIDSYGKEKIYGIIQNLKKDGYTIICITNLADEILLADRTLILKNGSIAAEIKKEELLEKSNLLEENGITIPTLLKILIKLENEGIKLNIKDYSINNFVEGVKKEINGYN